MESYAPGTRCSANSCVHVEQVGESFVVTSTIEGNDGSVTFTAAEWAAFGEQVKDGKWDATFREAQAHALWPATA